MNKLKRIIGKTILTANKDYDGDNYYLILKFKEGGKINISSYCSGEGISQLELDVYDQQNSKISDDLDHIIGKKIESFQEDYDGENNYMKIKFEDGDTLVLTAYSSNDESVAQLDVDIYESNNPKNMTEEVYLVEESLNEFAKRGRKRKAMRPVTIGDPDAWGGDDEDEGEIDPSKAEIEEAPEDEVGNPNLELAKALDHELSSPEFSRAYIKFKLLGSGEKLKAIPMAKMSGGEAYLFKTLKGDLKKVKLRDIILESLNEEAIGAEGDPFTAYMFEIGDIVKVEVPDFEEIIAEVDGSELETTDLMTWLEEDRHGFDFLGSFENGVPAEEAAMEVVQWFESVGYTEGEDEFYGDEEDLA